MEYLKTLEGIFEKLNDHRTITSLFFDLKDENEITVRYISTKRQTPFKRHRIDEKDYVFIVHERVISHEKNIYTFIQQFTDYLGKIDQKLYSTVFKNVLEKISLYQSQMQPYRVDFIEFKEFEDDTSLLIKSGELDERYSHDIWYQYCINQREKERSRLLDLLQNKILDVRDEIDLISIGKNNYTDPGGKIILPVPETIQWMKGLGVLNFILSTYCKRSATNTYNISKAATILNSFVPDITKDNWELKLTAIYGPKGNHAKKKGNDPADNPENVDYANRLAKNCKIELKFKEKR